MRLTPERVRALLAVKGMFGSVLLDAELVRDLAADLLDALSAIDAHRTRADAAEAERARCAAVCRAVAAALNDDTALECAEAIERAQVATLTTERDTAHASHAALAAAVRCYLAAVDEPTWDESSLVAVDAARIALDAALAAAGGA